MTGSATRQSRVVGVAPNCFAPLAMTGLERIGATTSWGYGSPEFTNEVQHFQPEVLPWGGLTSSYPLRSDARLPDFRPVAARSGKSQQLWIARHQRSLGS